MRPLAGLCFALLSLSWTVPALAQTAAIDSLQIDLQAAVCRNDWPQAIALISQLISNEDISPASREGWVQYRDQVEEWRSIGARFADLPACTVPASDLVPLTPSLPIAPLAALSPATALDLSSGSATHSGAVSSGQQVYQFEARAGDRMIVDINVSRILPGTSFRDDDSQLFLFDSAGRLIAENDDDGNSFESRIRNFIIPYDGAFFVVVTTFNNDPVLNSNGIVIRWESDGGSNIEYQLTVMMVATPPP